MALGLNAAFLVLELGVGLWTNSLALLSDAGHMVSDVGALAIALGAVKLAQRKPSHAYTFGLRRAPVLGGLLNAASLVVIVVLVGIEAIGRIAAPPPMEGMPVLWTGVAGLAVNLVSAWYLAASRDQSVNTRGAMLHLLADALGSVAAIASAVAIMAFDAHLADPVASLVIVTLILLGTWPLLRDVLRILLQRAPLGIDVAAVRATIEQHPGVGELADFHLWGLDDGQPVLSAVLIVEPEQLRAANQLTDALRCELHDHFHIEHVTFECRHPEAAELRCC